MKMKKMIAISAVFMMLANVSYAENIKSYTQTAVCNAKQTGVCCRYERSKDDAEQNMVLNMGSVTKQTEVCDAGYATANPNVVDLSGSSMEMEVVRQVNMERARYGLQPLTVSNQLMNAAYIRANEIAKKFSHTRPDGSKWSTVSSAALGENIARGHSGANRVMAAWMSSEGHRKNILRQNYGSIGVCALNVNGVIYWVQLFGR